MTIFRSCLSIGSPVIWHIVPKAPSAKPSTMICMPRNFTSQRESLDQSVDDHVQVVVDLIELIQLGIEVTVEHLDVPAFVHDLGRAVELAIQNLNGFGDLGRAAKSAPCSPCRNWLSIHDATLALRRRSSRSVSSIPMPRSAL